MGWAIIEFTLASTPLAINATLVFSPLPTALAPSPLDAIRLQDPEAYFYKVYDTFVFITIFSITMGILYPLLPNLLFLT